MLGGRASSFAIVHPHVPRVHYLSYLARITFHFIFISYHSHCSGAATPLLFRPPAPVKDIWPDQEEEGWLSPCRIARQATALLCQHRRTLGRGPAGLVPASALVTPDHALQFPWQPLHCAPGRPRVTTAEPPAADAHRCLSPCTP